MIFDVPSKLSAIISNYVEPLSKKRKYNSDFQEHIKEFFLDFVEKYPSYLTYSTRILPSEFNALPLTAHLSSYQRSAIDNQTHGINSDKVNHFINVLKMKGGIIALAKTDSIESLPLLALVGWIRRGDITQFQVASICLLYQGILQLIRERKMIANYYDFSRQEDVPLIQPIPLHFLVNYSPVLATYSVYGKAGKIAKLFFNFNKAQFKKFKNYLRKSPDSEQHFHTIDLPLGQINQWSPLYDRLLTILDKVPKPVKVEIGNPTFKNEYPKRMVIPSFTMIQVFLKVLYKFQEIRLQPLIGVCTKATIAHFKQLDKRVVQVGASGADVPIKADSFYCGPLILSIHDGLYHAVRDSALAQEERLAINQITDRILGHFQDEIADEICWKLVDGELHDSSEQKFGAIFQHEYWNRTYKFIVLKDMALLAQFWKESFGITRDDLYPEEQEIYDSIKVTAKDTQIAEATLFSYYYKRRADQNPYIQFMLGRFYFLGRGVLANHSRAEAHWLKAPTHAGANFNLGNIYQTGVEISLEKAQYYFQLAASQGRIFAYHRLALLHEKKGTQKDMSRAWQYLYKAITSGDLESLYTAGNWCVLGKGLSKDEAKAFTYYKEGADRGHPDCLLNVGVCYRDGRGVAQDLNQSFNCFSQGASLGNGDSCLELAVWYVNGKRVPRDLQKALDYCKKAVTLGMKKAPKIVNLIKAEIAKTTLLNLETGIQRTGMKQIYDEPRLQSRIAFRSFEPKKLSKSLFSLK